jgi:hypothetical protein
MIKLLLILLLSFATRASTFGTRGGGDINAEDFFNIVNTEIRFLNLFKSQDVLLFTGAYKNHKNDIIVRFTDNKLFLNDKEVQAINDPATLTIEISLQHWLKLTLADKLKLALHELVSLLAIPDNDYSFSAKLIDIANIAKKSAFKLWENKIVFKTKALSFNKTFYISKTGISFFEQKLDTDFFCTVNLQKPLGIEVRFSDVKIIKDYFFSPDYTYQKDTVSFILKSLNDTVIAKINCSNFNQEIGKNEAESITLEQFISLLSPLLKDLN